MSVAFEPVHALGNSASPCFWFQGHNEHRSAQHHLHQCHGLLGHKQPLSGELLPRHVPPQLEQRLRRLLTPKLPPWGASSPLPQLPRPPPTHALYHLRPLHHVQELLPLQQPLHHVPHAGPTPPAFRRLEARAHHLHVDGEQPAAALLHSSPGLRLPAVLVGTVPRGVKAEGAWWQLRRSGRRQQLAGWSLEWWTERGASGSAHDHRANEELQFHEGEPI